MESIGKKMTAGITLPLAAIGGFALKSAIDFESSFAGVRKTVDATEQEFAALAQGFRDLAKTMPVNVNELNKIGEAAGQLGVKKENILEFTKTMAMLGATTNLTSDQAATSIAQIQNIFNASGKETSNFGAALVDLGNKGASTERDIVEMGLRIAGAGNQIGLSQADVLGFAAALANVGINAEMGGSAISRVMSRISVDVDKGGAKLQNLATVAGMTGPAFAALFKTDAREALTRFVEGLGRAKDSGVNLTMVLEKLGFKNILTMDTMKRLAGAGDQLRTTLDTSRTAWQQNTALTDEFRERAKTTASQLQILWNRIQDVAITLGTALLPTLKALVAASDPAVKLAASLAEKFAQLPVPVQATAFGFLALVAAAGPAIFVAGTLIQSWGAVAGAMKLAAGSMLGSGGLAGALTTVLGILGGPWTLAVLAVGAGIAGILTATGSWGSAWRVLKDVVMIVVDALIIAGGWLVQIAAIVGTELLRGIRETSAAWASWIPDWVKNTLGWFADKLHEIRKVMDRIAGITPKPPATPARPEWKGATDRFDLAGAGVVGRGERGGFAFDEGGGRTLDLAGDAKKAKKDAIAALAGSLGGDAAKQIKELTAAWKFLTPVQRANTTIMENVVEAYAKLRGLVEPSALPADMERLRLQFERFSDETLKKSLEQFNDLMEQMAGAGMIIDAAGRNLMEQGRLRSGGNLTNQFLNKQMEPGMQLDSGGAALLNDTVTWHEQLDDLAGDFARLAQVSGDTFRGLLPSLSQGVGAFTALTGAVKAYTSATTASAKVTATWSIALTAATIVMQSMQAMAARLAAAHDHLNSVIAQHERLESLRAEAEAFGIAVDEAFQAKGLEDFSARIDKIVQQIADAKALVASRWEGVQTAVGALNAFTAEGIDSLGKYNIASQSAVAIFGAWVTKTGDVVAALNQIGPTLDAIALSQTTMGFAAGDAALTQLLGLRQVTEAQKPLMANIAQSTALLQALDAAGLLTNQNIIAFGQNAVNQFTLLKSATGDATTAMVLMRPQLQALWEHQEKFGIFADAATQALIDQAVTSGIVGAEMKSDQQQVLDVLKQIRDVLAGIAVMDIPDKTFKVTPDIGRIDIPDFPTRTQPQWAEPEGMASGGIVPGGRRVLPFPSRGTDTEPAMLTPGELVLNAAMQENLARDQQPGVTNNYYTINALDVQSFKDVVTRNGGLHDILIEDAGDNKRGRGTRWRAIANTGTR